eukprot:jgi/Ulvmu1/5784/UM025_0038.1
MPLRFAYRDLRKLRGPPGASVLSAALCTCLYTPNVREARSTADNSGSEGCSRASPVVAASGQAVLQRQRWRSCLDECSNGPAVVDFPAASWTSGRRKQRLTTLISCSAKQATAAPWLAAC